MKIAHLFSDTQARPLLENTHGDIQELWEALKDNVSYYTKQGGDISEFPDLFCMVSIDFLKKSKDRAGAHSWLSQFDEKLVTFQMFSEFVNDEANHSSEHLDDFLEALNLFFETTQELTISDHIINDDRVLYSTGKDLCFNFAPKCKNAKKYRAYIADNRGEPEGIQLFFDVLKKTGINAVDVGTFEIFGNFGPAQQYGAQSAIFKNERINQRLHFFIKTALCACSHPEYNFRFALIPNFAKNIQPEGVEEFSFGFDSHAKVLKKLTEEYFSECVPEHGTNETEFYEFAVDFLENNDDARLSRAAQEVLQWSSWINFEKAFI